MKPITIKIKGLRCDAPGCGYEQNDEPYGDRYEDWALWLNVPCPRCGASLLTQADLDTLKIMLRITRILNFVLWPLTALSTRKPVVYDLGMDGTGKVHPKRKEAE
jgi:hypothetical protein